MDLFLADDYKDYVRALLSENDTHRGYQSKLAIASGCQKSQFSQVLSGQLHLTLDQGAKLATFWEMDDNRTDFFLTLISLARASSPDLKAILMKRLRKLRAAHKEIGQRVQAEAIDERQAASLYYAAWHFSAIHVLISIKNYRTADQLAVRLKIPLQIVQGALETLVKIGLAEKVKDQWQRKHSNIHLPQSSPMTAINHLNWRHRAIDCIQRSQQNSVNYSSVFSVSLSDAEKMQHLLLQTVEKMRGMIASSPEEEAFSFNCDLFRI